MAFLLISNKLSGHLVQLDIVSFATRNAEGSQEWGGVRAGGGLVLQWGGWEIFKVFLHSWQRAPPIL